MRSSLLLAAGVALALFLGECGVRLADRWIARDVTGSGDGCDACGAPHVKAWSTSITGQLLGRGRRGCCAARLPPRGILAQLSLVAVAVGLASATAAGSPRALAAAALALSAATVLAIACVVDTELMVYPRLLLAVGLAASVASSLLNGAPIMWILTGAGGAFAMVMVVRRLHGKASIGLADAQFWAVVGALAGINGVVFFCLASAASGIFWHGGRKALGFPIELPAVVRHDRAELRELADDGDEEAKEMLETDPVFASLNVVPTGPLYALGLGALFVARDVLLLSWLQRGP